MFIDINAGVGHWPFRQTPGNTCEALLQRMDRYGIDLSVVSNLHGIFYKDTQAANEELYELMRSHRRFGDRMILFAVINPLYAGWKRDLKICRTRFGAGGIRLYPAYHDYGLCDPCCLELVRTARDLGMPVAFPLRMVDSRARSWMDVSKEWNLKEFIPLIREVPDARFLLLNVPAGFPLKEEEEKVLREHQVLLDTSGRNISDLGGLIQKLGKEKFALGTHSPLLDYVTALLRIESLRPDEADKTVRQLLRSGNAKRFLGL